MATDALVELTPWLDTRELHELLLALIGWRGEPARDRPAVDVAVDEYRRQPKLIPLGVVHDGAVAGMIGIETMGQRRGIIRHIVVASHFRRCGVGRLLIEESASHLDLARLEAETDVDAAEFYAKCGFAVRSLGEKYAARERFHCLLEVSDHSKGA